MSHFITLVIGNDPVKQLAPFNEQDPNYFEFVDKTDECKEEFETGKRSAFYCGSSSSWGMHITRELFKELKSAKIGTILNYEVKELDPFQYFQSGKKYCGYHTVKGGKRCKSSQWFEVIEVVKTTHPEPDVCFTGAIRIAKIAAPKKVPLKSFYSSFDEYADLWHGYEKQGDKYGYMKNPNAKWDWYQLGGRYEGRLKTAYGTDNVAQKKNILNLDEITTFAILHDGKWYEKGEMGWWGVVTDEQDEDTWKKQVTELLNSLHPDTMISAYDCHI